VKKHKYLGFFSLLGLLWLPVAFGKTAAIAPQPAKKSLHIVSYNVENLFDNEHDNGKNDWEFTPKSTTGKIAACRKIKNAYYRKSCLKSDWHKSRYEIKLEKIKEALLHNTQTLPDMLALVEIENKSVVQDLAAHLGYHSFHLSKSPDARGIDVALLYNETKDLKNIGKAEYLVDNDIHFKKKPTRNILEVLFQVAGKYTLSVFVNHWPSQSSSGAVRSKTAMVAKEAYLARLIKNPQHHILLTGDFNTIDADHPHPFKTVVTAGEHPLQDVRDLYLATDRVSEEEKKQLPLGTYFYTRNMVWNNLDRFFVNNRLKDGNGLELQAPSFKIYTKGITKDFRYDRPGEFHFGSVITKTPKRYNHRADSLQEAGFSDHFPISVKLSY